MEKIQEDFITIKGHKIFTRIHNTGHDQWLIVTHGIGEHSGRYDFIFQELSSRYNIFCYDLRGHGKSDGIKGHIDDFGSFKKDLNDILHYLKEKFSISNFSMFGHSMGALITADFIQNCRKLENSSLSDSFYPKRIFLSSPPASPGGTLGELALKVPDKVFSYLAKVKKYVFLGDLFHQRELSHDARTGILYSTDKLIAKKLSSSLILTLADTARKVFSKPLGVPYKYSCIVGTGDKIVLPRTLINYAQKIDTNMDLFLVEGGRHELHNEIDKYKDPYLEFLLKSL